MNASHEEGDHLVILVGSAPHHMRMKTHSSSPDWQAVGVNVMNEMEWLTYM